MEAQAGGPGSADGQPRVLMLLFPLRSRGGTTEHCGHEPRGRNAGVAAGIVTRLFNRPAIDL